QNRMMRRILKNCRNTRNSRRYSGYLRVPAVEYQRALISRIREDGASLIDMLKLHPLMDDLGQRINRPHEHAVFHRLVRGIIGGKFGSALKLDSQEFNQASEAFCRNTLRATHLNEAYADGLCGHRVLAIQAITAVVYTLTGLIGLHLYLESHLQGAYLTCVLTTQIWRILSEFALADYRGDRKISAYQYMAGITALSGVIYGFFLPAAALEINLTQGLHILWNPAVLLTCQVLWMGIFLFTGRSKVTAARISLFVHSDRI
ncbi:MAG: hypothetical protein P8X55_11615, partial [Desulfosarcinaceae bacterium]